MKKQNKTSAVGAMKQTKGRFFGLYLKSGEAINAQFRNETEKTVSVYDRNNNRKRVINKTSIDHIYTNGRSYAA